MGTPQDEDKALTNQEAALTEMLGNLSTLITETTNEISRFLAKLAAGNPPSTSVDLQPEIDRINAITQKLADANATIISATAQVKVEGN